MLQTTSCFFVTLLFAANGQQQKQVLYSRLLNEVNDFSLAVIYLKAASFVNCATLCSVDDYCAEFLYSEFSAKCIGLHLVNKGTYTYQDVAKPSVQMLHFKKEFNWTKYAGHLYFYGGKEAKFNWTDAKLECQKMGAYLVEIESKKESSWLTTEFLMKEYLRYESHYDCSAWTGLNDIDAEGRYVWNHSNTTALFTNWYPGQPSLKSDTYAVKRDCIDMLKTGQWNDRPCNYLNSFICEKKFEGS